MTDLEKFIISRWTYSIGRPIISDAEYTILREAMEKIYPTNEYVTRSWSSDPCPVDLLLANNMEEYIQSVLITDKTESIPSLGSYAEIEASYSDLDEKCTLSYKHDGWNIQFSYFNSKLVWAQTRGRATNSKATQALMKLVPRTIPVQGKVTVVSECTIPNDIFPKVKQLYGNEFQRSAVSTLIARGDEALEFLSIHAFDIKGEYVSKHVFNELERWKFQTPEWVPVTDYNSLLLGIRKLDSQHGMYGLPTDGLVISGTKTRALRVLSWEEPIYRSFIDTRKPYIESFGAQYIAVQLNVYPIRLPNGTQTQIPITNYQRVIDNNLRAGYPIAFRLKSHAIANIDTEATRLLQAQYADNYAEYRQQIRRNEDAKRVFGLDSIVSSSDNVM